MEGLSQPKEADQGGVTILGDGGIVLAREEVLRGRGVVKIPGRGRRAASLLWEDSGRSPAPGRRRTGRWRAPLSARPATAPRAPPPSRQLSPGSRLRPLPGVGSFPRSTVQRRTKLVSGAGTLPHSGRLDPELTWCPWPPAQPARPLFGSQDVRPPPARLPAVSAFTAVPGPRPSLSRACASASCADYKSRQTPQPSRLQFLALWVKQNCNYQLPSRTFEGRG